MKNYRIVKEGNKYKIEERFLFWWTDFKTESYLFNGMHGFVSKRGIIVPRFNTQEDAESAYRHLKKKKVGDGIFSIESAICGDNNLPIFVYTFVECSYVIYGQTIEECKERSSLYFEHWGICLYRRECYKSVEETLQDPRWYAI